jgi:hypothetical protein
VDNCARAADLPSGWDRDMNCGRGSTPHNERKDGMRLSLRSSRLWLLVGLVTTSLMVVFIVSAGAVISPPTCLTTNHVTGSNFEIEPDANLVDGPGDCIDWLDGGAGSQFMASVQWKNDLPTGSGDDSFGNGTAEDNPNPTIVDGSIPPNKSDLKAFGVNSETTTAGKFLQLFWSRVQNPSGTTNMDFELNAIQCDGTAAKCANNGTKTPVFVTPKRSVGDKLITYDLSKGGTVPSISIRSWTGSAWGPATTISGASSTAAFGSVNTSAIAADGAGGIGPLSPFTFGEASISYAAIFSGSTQCGTFGSAYLKSRSSDSFTAALKDFIAPTETGLNNCGALKIVKTKKHAESVPSTQPHAGVVFGVTGGTLPAGTTVTTDASGVACIAGIESGSYTVTETVPTGYAVTSANPQTGTVVEDTTCVTATPVTFTNVPLTNITVSVDSQIPGGTASTIDCDAAADPPFDFTTPAGGDGSFSLNDKVPGTYVCTIIVDP